jgi:hypothetical protein
MRLNYKDVKNVIEYNNSITSNRGYGFPLLPKLNDVIGNIRQGQVHIITGLPSSGVTSFLDQNYVMSVLLQWYDTEPEKRQKIKILYYSMKDSQLKKLQLLLCNYLKLVNNLKTDILTLNNQVGKQMDLNTDTVLKKAIEDASGFFNEILDNEILIIKDGQYKPTDIYNDVVKYMGTIGKKNKENFEYETKYEDQITLVVVDSTDYFIPDNDGFGILTGNALDDKFQKTVRTLKKIYNVSFAIVTPTIQGFIRTPKDTEPHFRNLGSYGSLADKAICIYNPINEKNIKFYNGEEDIYISPRGSILMRTWHVVRNIDGVENYDRMLFLPGTSYMMEYTYKNKLDDIDDILDALLSKTCFYN